MSDTDTFLMGTVYDALKIWAKQGGTTNIGPRQTTIFSTGLSEYRQRERERVCSAVLQQCR